MKHVQIFTEGACKGNPGKGGWGALLRMGEIEKELSEAVVALQLAEGRAAESGRSEQAAVVAAEAAVTRRDEAVAALDAALR